MREDKAGDWLAGSIQHLVSEAEAQRPGAAILLSRMAESLFVEALRRVMARLPAEQKGWLAGARDPIVGSALALLHRQSSHAWTLTRLAREAGSSRSVLAKRFVHFLGETPPSYLRQLRLHLAAERLRISGDSILRIATDVGYRSEAAFNRGFRIAYDQPPARYRRRALSEPGKVVGHV
jgi:transcriptional regulator GlxA family with amidase domain